MTDAPTDTPTDAPSEEVPDTDWKAEAEKLKAESRKWETRSKENQKAAQRLAEIEESQKTELQKAVERAERAEQRAAQFESAQQINSWKSEVAEKAGVPADVLRGSTREELEAHAETLAPLLNASKRGPYVPSPGNIPDTPVSNDAAFAASLFGSH